MKDDPEFNIKFVHLVEERPCLYDNHNPDYTNRDAQDSAWESIATEVSESVLDCRERWKNLRVCYTRYLKILNESQINGNTKYRKPYYLTEHLRFLKPFTKSRKPRSNVSQNVPFSALFPETSHLEENSEEESEGTLKDFIGPDDPRQQTLYDSSNKEHMPVFAPLFPKRIKTEPEDSVPSDVSHSESSLYQVKKNSVERSSELENADFLFLKSILPDMKEMNRAQKRKFKIGILNLAGEILNESDTTAFYNVPPSHPSSSTSLNNNSVVHNVDDHNLLV